MFGSLGCRLNEINEDDLVVVAVKPWQIREVVDLARRARGIVSIVSGVDLFELQELFSTSDVVRVMPNTPVEMLEGATFVCGESTLVAEVVEIFKRLGRVFVVEEKTFSGGMALASCGVAYALRYARASIVGGVELGVGAKLGQQIVAQTLRGAAALLETGEHPEYQIDKVTTPGGNTIKGLNAMEANGFTNSVIEGVKNSIK